jgi:hypothetical protein
MSAMDQARKWNLAWSHLDAFEKHMPTSIEEKHVAEFHGILDLFHDATGEDVSPFRIPEEELKKVSVAARLATRRTPGQVWYSDKKYCDHDLMLRKIATLRGYFEKLYAADKRKYGFKGRTPS